MLIRRACRVAGRRVKQLGTLWLGRLYRWLAMALPIAALKLLWCWRAFWVWVVQDEMRGNQSGERLAAWLCARLEVACALQGEPYPMEISPPVVDTSRLGWEDRLEHLLKQQIPVVLDFRHGTTNDGDGGGQGGETSGKSTNTNTNSPTTPSPAPARSPNDVSAQLPPPLGWTRAFLRKRFGNTLVPLTDRGGNAHKLPLERLFEQGGHRYYLKGSDTLFKAEPKLATKVAEFTAPIKEVLQMPLQGSQMFLANNASTAGLGFHCANRLNVCLLLDGEKTWTLVSPEYSHLMYPAFLPGAALMFSCVGHAHTYATDTKKQAEAPLFNYAPKWRVRLQAGQAIVNPSWWWHSIENHGGSVAVATRWGFSGSGNNDLFDTLQLCSVPLFMASVNNRAEARGDLDHDEHTLTPQERRTCNRFTGASMPGFYGNNGQQQPHATTSAWDVPTKPTTTPRLGRLQSDPCGA
eukprot:m.183374 g.183374  ORF g.183374 m.183374 type:complete len:465 (+) comp18078_c0_seq1:123-1517(+)